ncbi:unnamed protein product [Pedinophyceae sp. YPF-701]|nr:unnamed protein product [Pedinophyceae sp. YPF-701]
MITYSKVAWGLGLLRKVYGSAFPRALPVAFISAMVTLVLHLTCRDYLRDMWVHPYPYSTFSWVVGFLLVFRANSAYARYWEAATGATTMAARLCAATVSAVIFDADHSPKGRRVRGAATHPHLLFRERLLHLVSLLHGLALQNLRSDWDLTNLTKHVQRDAAPDLDPRVGAKKQDFKVGLTDVLVLQSGKRRRRQINRVLPLPVLGDVLQSERDALYQGAEGGSLSSGQFSARAQERVAIVHGWIHQLLRRRVFEGGLEAPAPLTTRLYQELADAMLAYEQLRKLAYLPFPFPTSQMVVVLVLLYAATMPLLVTAWITKAWFASGFCFLAVLTYAALSEVARDLEDPFLYDANDIPCARLQYEFNERLLAEVRGASTTEIPCVLAGDDLLAEVFKAAGLGTAMEEMVIVEEERKKAEEWERERQEQEAKAKEKEEEEARRLQEMERLSTAKEREARTLEAIKSQVRDENKKQSATQELRPSTGSSHGASDGAGPAEPAIAGAANPPAPPSDDKSWAPVGTEQNV